MLFFGVAKTSPFLFRLVENTYSWPVGFKGSWYPPTNSHGASPGGPGLDHFPFKGNYQLPCELVGGYSTCCLKKKKNKKTEHFRTPLDPQRGEDPRREEMTS